MRTKPQRCVVLMAAVVVTAVLMAAHDQPFDTALRVFALLIIGLTAGAWMENGEDP